MNASYVDDLDGVGKVIVTQVNLLKLFDVTTDHNRVRNRTRCWTSGGWLSSIGRGILSCSQTTKNRLNKNNESHLNCWLTVECMQNFHNNKNNSCNENNNDIRAESTACNTGSNNYNNKNKINNRNNNIRVE